MNKLKQQFTKISTLLFSTETGKTYGSAIKFTWDILRETARLLWLLLCFIFLIFFWGGGYATQAGRNLRVWYADLDDDRRNNLLASAWGSLQQVFKGSPSEEGSSRSPVSLVHLAKSQLGIVSDPPALKAIPPAPIVATTPSAEPVEETVATTTPIEPIEKTDSSKKS